MYKPFFTVVSVAWVCRFVLAIGILSSSLHAAELPPVYTTEDVDLAASKIFRGSELVDAAISARAFRAILGLPGAKPGDERIAGAREHNNTDAPLVISYLLVFKQELPMGSLLVDRADQFRILKPGVTGPVSAAKANQWQELPAAKMSRGNLRLATAANGTKTRALFMRASYAPRREVLPISYLRVLAERLGNISPLAIANAESEHTVEPDMGPPFTLAANHVPQGRGTWANTGENKEKRIPRGPISDVSPSWFVLSWEQAQTFQSLYLEDNHSAIEFYTYSGPEGLNPAVAHDREWKKIRDWKASLVCANPRGSIIRFAKPVSTRGLKLVILKSSGGPVAAIDALHVYQDLGRNPVPEAAVFSEVPPFQIPLTAPLEGTLSLVIDDANGKRVANVQGRVPRSPGELQEGWDLKDFRGVPVTPGTYRYTALFMPELELKYQMTPYPNVEQYSDNTPWMNGASGSGGWLSDHGGIMCVTTGDNGKLYFGSGVSEAGQTLIECDAEGRRQWGHGNFVAWTGPTFLTFGEGKVFGASRAHWNLTDHIWTVQAEDKKIDTLLAVKSTNRRLRGISGITYRKGEVYVAIDAEADWMASAADGSDVDSDLCLPRYRIKSKEDRFDPDSRNDFKRLFRLTGTPAGQGTPGKLPGLTYINSTDLPGSKNHALLTFKRPVEIGSFIFPFPEGEVEMRIKVLKKEGAYPPQPDSKKDWLEIYRGRKGSDWQVVTAPEGLSSRAICLTYSNSEDDLLDLLSDDVEPEKGPSIDLLLDGVGDGAGSGADDVLSGGGTPWRARLEGMKIMRRRFAAAAEGLKVRVNSGEINERGEWDAQRSDPINESKPGIYCMEWAKAQSLRGLAIKEIDGKRTEIDVYTGPAGTIPLEGSAHWKRVATYEQALRDFYQPGENMNARARYIDGYVDFGEEINTRAVRLRVVEQWTTTPDRPFGVRQDRGGQELDATRCRVYGVAALTYLGGEVPVDPLTYSRLEVYDAKTGALARELPATKLSHMTVDPQGRLYGISGSKIVVLQADDTWKTHITDTRKPLGLTTDEAGNLYVFDGDHARKQVRVYDPAGLFLRSIGKAGGYKQGPFDPEYITASGRDDKVDLAVDAHNKLWITDGNYSLKRVSRWNTDGSFDRDYYGNTSYGGGGVLDITDTRRVFFAQGNSTTEFGLDWKTGKTRINAMAWMGDSRGGEYVIPIEGRTYLVTRPNFGYQACGYVYLYEGEKGCRRVAAVGSASDFKPLLDKSFYAKIGNRVLGDLHFTWSDANGDGNPQPDEVTFIEMKGNVSWFDEGLGIHAEGMRYEVAQFRPDGVPVYRTVKAPGLKLTSRRLSNSQTLAFNQQRESNGPFFNRVVDADGETSSAWQTEGMGVHAYYKAGPYTERQVVAEFDVIGTSRDNGELGDVFVSNSNVGKMHIWTYDGILAGSLFQDIRSRNRQGWPTEKPEPGLAFNQASLGQEHFSGWYGKSVADGKHYVVVGFNHISVAEVVGLDKARRVTGSLTVTPEHLRAAHAWETAQARQQAYEAAKVYHCPIGDDKRLDGDLKDWKETFIRPDNEEGV
ncbi:MAG: hypothetical protein ACI97B_002048, partial [Verrucomicrobiales bacterium]